MGQGVAPDRRLNGVLDIRRIDLVPRGGVAIDGEVEVRLPDHTKEPEILDAGYCPHDADDLFTRVFERPEIITVHLDRQFSLDPAHRFFHIVGNGLGEVPNRTGNPLELAAHRRDEFLLVFVEERSPFFLCLEIDEIFGVEEPGPVCPVIRPTDLACYDRDFREGGEDHAHVVRDADPFTRSRAWRERTTDPDRALIEMWEELRPNDATQRVGPGERQRRDRDGDPTPIDREHQHARVRPRQRPHDRVVPFPRPLWKHEAGEHRTDDHREQQPTEEREGHGPGHRLE